MGGRRNPTNGDTRRWNLTPQQAAAIDLLAAGRTVSETAQGVGVVRQTVSEWLHHHHGFRAEVDRRRQELWEAATDRLRALMPKAVDVIAGELEGENPLQAAVHILKACGLYGVTVTLAPTDPRELELSEREQEQEREERAAFAELP